MRPTNRLATIFQSLQSFYDADSAKDKLTNLRLSMFCDESSPHVKPPFLNIKGGEAKAMLLPLASVMRLADDGSELHAHILEAFRGMLWFVSLMDSADIVPTLARRIRAIRVASRALSNRVRSGQLGLLKTMMRSG